MAELTFAPCWTIAFMTLTSCVALIVSSAYWGGYPFTIVAYVMWWFVQTWNAISLFWAFTILIRRHEASSQRLPTSIIIPAVSVSTIGLTGAVVSTYSYDISACLAVPVMILSFSWTGIGILLGLILTSWLFHAILADGWPVPDQTASMFILVGPMGNDGFQELYRDTWNSANAETGQSAAALQILGAGASTYGRFSDYDAGTFITAEAAKGLAPACTLIALLLNGLGVIWLILGLIAVGERALRGQLRWTPAVSLKLSAYSELPLYKAKALITRIQFNAAVFPNATLTTSMLAFSIDLDSPAYRVITAIMIICLVIVYLINLVYTVMRVWQGKLLIVREDWRVKQQLDQQKEE